MSVLESDKENEEIDLREKSFENAIQLSVKNHLQKMEVNPFNSGLTIPNPKRQRFHENGPIEPA
jgi:hypothetical protein